ncbi:MAG: LysM peptidoglycan-binding domain-containing protein, partial [Phycisphaerales bacterium]|nr:LysM peptidoglycan-binding domain-containing protein [Phycisphaerales bacterium]
DVAVEGGGVAVVKELEYVVKKGDCLSLIAARHVGSGDKVAVGKMVEQIAVMNKIKDVSVLRAGAKLKLPAK